MSDKVLLTGISGWIAKHTAIELLNAGYEILGTVRNNTLIEQTKETISQYASIDKLSFTELDLLKDDGWNEALKGCDAIIHIAGPFPVGFEGGEKELTGPHEDGAMRVFNLAKDNGISRIILTSSVASIWMDSTIDDTVRYIDENNWTNLSDANLDAYTKGKALKEKAAWDFVEKNDSIKLTTSDYLFN